MAKKSSKPRRVGTGLLILQLESVLSASFLAVLLLFPASYYIHEGGHMIFGTIGNLLYHRTFCIPHVSNWKTMWVMPIPQQTRNCAEGLGSPLFAFGGLFGIFIFGLALIWVIPKKLPKTPKSSIHLILAVLLVHEVVANGILGTDNNLGRPLLSYEQNSLVSVIVDNLGLIFMVPFVLVFYPYREIVLNFVLKITRKSQK